MSQYMYPLPHGTENLVRDDGIDVCANPGLLFDRYIGYGPNWSLKTEHGRDPKDAALKAVKEANERLQSSEWQELRQFLVERWTRMVQTAGASSEDKTLFSAAPQWRFLAGIGRNSPLEVGFSFDRVYGLPLLSGSSLKGLTRSYVLWTWAYELGVPLLQAEEVKARRDAQQPTPIEQLERVLTAADDDTRGRIFAELCSDSALDANSALHVMTEAGIGRWAEMFRTVFGAVDQRGGTVFFDAMPEKVVLKEDVLTPHYPEYYNPQDGSSWPTDWQDPQPVPFLTVAEGSVFRFAVAGADQQRAADWLRNALWFPGAGAKTAAGYGAWAPQFFDVEP